MPQSTIQWRAEASADELATRADEMRKEWAELSKSDRESDAYRAAKTQFITEMEDIDVNLTLRNMATVPEALRGQTRGGDNGTLDAGGHDFRSAGQQVTEQDAFKEWARTQISSSGVMAPSPLFELRSLVPTTPEMRAVVAQGDTNGSSSLLPVGQPFLVDTRRRRLFIRDLIGVQQTTLSNIPYVRELNPVANALSASTVAEQGTKPEATIQLTPDNAPVQVIAITLPVTTQIVEDAPTLMGYINGRLTYMLQYREEDEIIRGNGVTPDLKGLLSYSGIQTQATAGAGEYAITIGNAIAKIELVDGYADGVAMNPATFWAMVTHRAAAGAGTFDAGAFTQSPIQYVWGLPVVRTNAMAANQNLVGNFGMGATLFDRSQSGVRIFEQHSDYAAKNMVLLRGEERVALAVNRPDFFCVATTS